MHEVDKSWLSARFDAIEARLERMDARADAQRTDIETRVRSLESWRTFVAGVAAAVGAAVAWIGHTVQQWWTR